MRHLMLALMLAVAAGCTRTETPQSTTTGPDVEAVTAWLGQYDAAVTAGDVEGVLNLYVDRPVSMPPDVPPVTDKEGLRTMLESFLAENETQLTSHVDEAVGAGDLAFLRVTYDESWTPKGEGEPGVQHGSWLIVLKKQFDGTWALWRDMWTAEVPPATPQM